ncbi:MAG: ABC-three component system protein [Gemmatimonas sp.]
MVRATIRESVAERLQERWDRQVALALMGRRDRAIRRGELSAMVEELIREHGDLALPNDFGARLPDADEFAAAKGGLLERQIELVNGGVARVQRAVRDRWRARNQRQRWMDDDASLVVELKVYDDLLKTEWGDRHGPMCDDCRAYDETERARRGLEVLEWAHAVAPITVRPPRPSWSESFYVRGMLQQFADDLEVGWHPAYRERLGGVASTLTASGVDASTEPLQPGPGAQVVEDDDGPYKPDIVDVRMNVDSVAASALRDQVPSDLVPDAPSVTVCSRPVRRARRSTPKATD